MEDTRTTDDVTESDAHAQATADLVAALGEMEEPTKAGHAVVRSQKGEYSYRYLELPDLLSTVRSAFAQHRLAVMQHVTTVDSGVQIVTVILHASGHSWSSPALFLRCAPDPQSIGGASTYGRRYSLAAMVGLAGAEDNDAESVSAPRKKASAPGGRTTTVQVAPPPPDQPEPPPPDGNLITPAQMRKVSALVGEWETLEARKLDRTERRRLIGFYAGVPDPDALESANQLTREQASTATEALTEALEVRRREAESEPVDGETVGAEQ